jgi:hypothetical protein
MLLQPSSAYQQLLALSANEAWKTPSTSAPWDHTYFQILAEPRTPLNDAPIQQEADRSISAHNTNKRLEC